MPGRGGVADHPRKDKPTENGLKLWQKMMQYTGRTLIFPIMLHDDHTTITARMRTCSRVRGPLRAKISAATRLASRLLLGT